MATKNGNNGLLEIGMDGFAELESEEGYGGAGATTMTTRLQPPPVPRPLQQPRPQTNHPQQPFSRWNRRSNFQWGPGFTGTASATNNFPPSDAIDCNQAAKKYNGVLLKDAGRKRKSLFSFRRVFNY